MKPAIEAAEIHAATCRARKQGLICGTCTQLDQARRRAVAAEVR